MCHELKNNPIKGFKSVTITVSFFMTISGDEVTEMTQRQCSSHGVHMGLLEHYFLYTLEEKK